MLPIQKAIFNSDQQALLWNTMKTWKIWDSPKKVRNTFFSIIIPSRSRKTSSIIIILCIAFTNKYQIQLEACSGLTPGAKNRTEIWTTLDQNRTRTGTETRTGTGTGTETSETRSRTVTGTRSRTGTDTGTGSRVGTSCIRTWDHSFIEQLIFNLQLLFFSTSDLFGILIKLTFLNYCH